MHVDLPAPRFSERPWPRLDGEIERADAMNHQRLPTTHRITPFAIA
jgi:hypothetical protein